MIIPGRYRALVVDDNAHVRTICSVSLTKLGVEEIVEASGGAEAVLQLMTTQFSVVLLDWYMPDVNGAGVMQVLRDVRFGAAADTPVILMSAYASRDNLMRAKDLGVNEIIGKPFTTEQIGAALGRVLTSESHDRAVFL